MVFHCDTNIYYFYVIINSCDSQGIFNGPETRKLIDEDEKFSQALNAKQLRAWNAFKQMVHNFFGKRRSEDYHELIDELLLSFREMGCRMSVKLHFLHTHRDKFPLPNEVSFFG